MSLSGCGSCGRADPGGDDTSAASETEGEDPRAAAEAEPRGSWQLGGEMQLDAEVAPLPIKAGEEHRILVTLRGVGERGIKHVELKVDDDNWRRMLRGRAGADGTAHYQSRVMFPSAGLHAVQLRVTKQGQPAPERVDDWTVHAE
jgi:hypothetical protein